MDRLGRAGRQRALRGVLGPAPPLRSAGTEGHRAGDGAPHTRLAADRRHPHRRARFRSNSGRHAGGRLPSRHHYSLRHRTSAQRAQRERRVQRGRPARRHVVAPRGHPPGRPPALAGDLRAEHARHRTRRPTVRRPEPHLPGLVTQPARQAVGSRSCSGPTPVRRRATHVLRRQRLRGEARTRRVEPPRPQLARTAQPGTSPSPSPPHWP
jgi:hypothetical protein